MKKISVIVPIYNAESYLEECIDSIIGQTYNNLEVILVNDGSRDQSLQICKEYEKKDERIIVINKPNSGVSETRNIGLKKSTGDYITFVDSDDFLNIDAYKIAMKYLTNQDYDIIEYSYYSLFPNGNLTKKQLNNDIAQGSGKILEYLVKGENSVHAVWNKVYKKNIISNLEFREFNYSEDYYFNIEVATRAATKIVINDFLYFYRQVPNSLMNSNFSPQKLDRISVRNEILRDLMIGKYSYLSKYVVLNLVLNIYTTIIELFRSKGKPHFKYLSYLEKEFKLNYKKLDKSFIKKNTNYKVYIRLKAYNFNSCMFYKFVSFFLSH